MASQVKVATLVGTIHYASTLHSMSFYLWEKQKKVQNSTPGWRVGRTCSVHWVTVGSRRTQPYKVQRKKLFPKCMSSSLTDSGGLWGQSICLHAQSTQKHCWLYSMCCCLRWLYIKQRNEWNLNIKLDTAADLWIEIVNLIENVGNEVFWSLIVLFLMNFWNKKVEQCHYF